MSLTQAKRKNMLIIIQISLIITILFSCLFASNLEVLFLLEPNITPTSHTQVHFIDVGQGDCAAIKFSNGKIMLVDSGTQEYRRKLSYYLDNIILTNSNTIDYLLLTHPDVDHSGNVEYLLDNYQINTFIRPSIYESYENKSPSCENQVYRNILQKVVAKNINTIMPSTKVWYEGNVKINMLNPIEFVSNVNTLDTNDFSPVVIINDEECSVLLAGDISSKIENIILNNYDNNLLDVDILKLSHHGSKYSSSVQFINATSPKYVVATCGENTYGHPANETLQRLLDYDKSTDSKTFNNLSSTQLDGNIVYSLDSNINKDIIKNVDDYNFVSYYNYAIIMVLYILYLIVLPYFTTLNKNRRFDTLNRQYVHSKEHIT